MDGLLDHTEQLLRREIASWPDGTATFTDYMDSDGIDVRDVEMTVDLTIRGDEVIADFSRSAPMVRGALNSTPSFAEASVYQTVMAASAIDIPRTGGAIRPITVITKPGTVMHVLMPGASSMRGITGYRLSDVMNGALAQLVPDRVPAAGEGGIDARVLHRHRAPAGRGSTASWSSARGAAGRCRTATTGSRTRARDGEHPGRGRRDRVADRGRALRARARLGRRGAVPRRARGRARLAVVAPDTTVHVRSDRQIHRPYGLDGGGEGAASSTLIFRAGGELERMPPMFGAVLQPGDVMHHRMAGGGGHGNPLRARPARRGAATCSTTRCRSPPRASCTASSSATTAQLDLEATDALRRSAVR